MGFVEYTQDPSTGLTRLGLASSSNGGASQSQDGLGKESALIELNPAQDANLFIHLPWITASVKRVNKNVSGPSYSQEVQTSTFTVKGKFYRTSRDIVINNRSGDNSTRVDNASFYFLTCNKIFMNDQISISGKSYMVKGIEIIPSNNNSKAYRVKLETNA